MSIEFLKRAAALLAIPPSSQYRDHPYVAAEGPHRSPEHRACDTVAFDFTLLLAAV